MAARNEGEVIGQLVETLQRQNYPKELYQVTLVPNNCTDDTREVARRAGARIYDCALPVRSKGDVLRQMFRTLLREDLGIPSASLTRTTWSIRIFSAG